MSETSSKPAKPWYLKWWVWLVAAFVVAGGIGAIVNPPAQVEIPDVAGVPAVEATAELKELGFSVTIKNGDLPVINAADYDAESTDPTGSAREGARITLYVVEATERLATEAAAKEQAKAEEAAAKEAQAEAARAKDESRAASLEQAIKNAFGGAEFSTLLLEDPTMWVGWISQVRVEGSNAYIRLQLVEEGPDDNIGERAAQALSTLLAQDDVQGIDWIIVEDATGTVIGQKQPAPIL